MGVGNWMTQGTRTAGAFVRRFAQSSRGNVAMIFALTMPVLVMITMGGVDIHRASTVRVNLQDALDAATLAAARSKFVTDAELKDVGLRALKANLQAYPDITLRDDLTTFTLNADSVVIANAKVDVKTLVANIILPPYGKLLDDTMPVGAHSEVNRSSKNIEVALVLDITGSMAGQRIIDLKAAATDLVDIVVQDVQTPYYTRMSVIPYSIGVNMGSYANSARGTPIASRPITGASWSTGSSKAISGITRASPGVVTSSSHGFVTGDVIWISGVSGMTQINDRAYRVVTINTNSFSLQSWTGSAWSNVNTTSGNGYSSYSSSSSDIARKCRVSDCSIVITANSHGVPAIDPDTGAPGAVYLSGIGGMSPLLSDLPVINGAAYEIANVTTDTFSIGVAGANYAAYTVGGASWCGQVGCQWRAFRNVSGALKAFPISSCVSERTGTQAYTDASTSLAKVGRNYAASANPCPAAQILPLSSNKTTIKALIDGLAVTGSTSGQIGLAWGWYSIAPNFSSLWAGPTVAPYDPAKTLKAVIMMTDGEFNTPYCGGVIARDAGWGSGSSNDHIICDATQGDPFVQAAALCTAMKAQGVVVYTVGFSITPGGSAAQILSDCATSPKQAFLPASGADLSEAFAAIGRDITNLRISK